VGEKAHLERWVFLMKTWEMNDLLSDEQQLLPFQQTWCETKNTRSDSNADIERLLLWCDVVGWGVMMVIK
jgi:hypothetical protein